MTPPWTGLLGAPRQTVFCCPPCHSKQSLGFLLVPCPVAPMVAINARGTVLYCNEATTQLFRWERAELVGKNVKVLPRHQLSSLKFSLQEVGFQSMPGSNNLHQIRCTFIAQVTQVTHIQTYVCLLAHKVDPRLFLPGRNVRAVCLRPRWLLAQLRGTR